MTERASGTERTERELLRGNSKDGRRPSTPAGSGWNVNENSKEAISTTPITHRGDRTEIETESKEVLININDKSQTPKIPRQTMTLRVRGGKEVSKSLKYKKPIIWCPCSHKKNKVKEQGINRFELMGDAERGYAVRELWQKSIREVIKRWHLGQLTGALLGSVQAESHQKEKLKVKCLILPGSTFRIIWDLIMLILIGYMCLVTPFVLSFMDSLPPSLVTIEYIIISVFALDIVITFFSAFYSHSLLVVDRGTIALNYLRTHFVIDLISCIPLNTLIDDETHTDDGTPYESKRMFVLLILLKLLKLGRILHFIEFFMDRIAIKFRIRPETEKGLKALLALIFSVHIFACMWFLVARLYNFGQDTWVIRTGYQDAAIFEQYLVAIYWVFQTLTTVGYGDVSAVTNGERILSIAIMSFGVAFYSSIFQPMEESKKQLRAKILTLAMFAKKHNVPNEVAARVRDYVTEHSDDFYEGLHIESMFEDLPINLKAELMNYSVGATLNKIKIFKNLDPTFYWKFGTKMKLLRYSDGENLYNENDVVEGVYFIKSGDVNLINANTGKLLKFTKNSYFGEIELLACVPRQSTAIIRGETEIYFIKKKNFRNILQEYPELLKKIKDMATHRSSGRTKINAPKISRATVSARRSGLLVERPDQLIEARRKSDEKSEAQLHRPHMNFPGFPEWKSKLKPGAKDSLITEISEELNPGENLEELTTTTRKTLKALENLGTKIGKEGDTDKAIILIQILNKVIKDNVHIGGIKRDFANLFLYFAYLMDLEKQKWDSLG